MSDIRAVVVPKELYYHEVAYVRGLEAEVERLKGALTAMIEIIDAAGRIDVIGQTSWYVKASDQLDAARAALETKP